MVHAVFSFTAGWFCGKSTQGARSLLKALPFSFSHNTECETFSAVASVVLNRKNNIPPLRSIKKLIFMKCSEFSREGAMCCKCKLLVVIIHVNKREFLFGRSQMQWNSHVKYVLC